jgi:hypothetical protein
VATLDEIRQAVAQLLGHQDVPAMLQLNSNTRERAFEAYIFALVLRAVRSAGGVVTLRGAQSGRNPQLLVFRGGPGHLGSRAQDFCYAECALNGREFEAHVDVLYLGNSGAAHEVDVSICDRTLADSVRNQPGLLPSTRGLQVAIECKFYDSELGTARGRTFVGLVDDCGNLKIKIFASNGQCAPLATYLSKRGRPQPFFNVSPFLATNGDRLASVIEQALRQWARVP